MVPILVGVCQFGTRVKKVLFLLLKSASIRFLSEKNN